MPDWVSGLSRRRFLSKLAVIGAAPVWTQLDALTWQQSSRQFTGDDFALAHKLLFDPDAVLRAGTPEDHPDVHDVLVVGGGIAGLTVAFRLRNRNVLLLEASPDVGGVSKSETWNGLEYAIPTLIPRMRASWPVSSCSRSWISAPAERT
jgi:hypothetical protein